MGPTELKKISEQVIDSITGEITYTIQLAEWESLLEWMGHVRDVLESPLNQETELIPWDDAVAQLREAGIDV